MFVHLGSSVPALFDNGDTAATTVAARSFIFILAASASVLAAASDDATAQEKEDSASDQDGRSGRQGLLGVDVCRGDKDSGGFSGSSTVDLLFGDFSSTLDFASSLFCF